MKPQIAAMCVARVVQVLGSSARRVVDRELGRLVAVSVAAPCHTRALSRRGRAEGGGEERVATSRREGLCEEDVSVSMIS